MKKLKLVDLIFDEITQMGIMLFEEETITEPQQVKVLPIWIGIFEAQSIMFKLQNLVFPRPLTHDLLKNCIEQLSGKIEKVIITKIQDNTFYAEIHILRGSEKIIIDSRPSDAVALAIRADAPIYVSDEVMLTAAVDKEEFMKEQKDKLLRQLLEVAETEEDKKLKH
ncbi:MAG: bifunctional nuclease family protein [Endomicrobia bacterium]|nr:bifunctional nuclease family protein [Endomicrobiia bacterium]MDW8055573.1 bifunctional nuclease family protein [Elusimicrobiota bacterium]